MSLDGLLLIDKQTGCTSHDVVQQARRALGQRKIGHCGTLDPDATGLLVLTLGRATRLTRFLINAPKVYGGTIRFGVTTDTYDASGAIVDSSTTEGLTIESLAAAMRSFEGESQQAAPPFSAKKVGGVKYYELARRGEKVPESTKPITIFSFETVGSLADERIEFLLSCTSGTYVRSVAHDLGQQLGTGAHLEALRRLRVGPFAIESSAPMDTVERDRLSGQEDPPSFWIPIDSIPLPFSDIVADNQQADRLRHGQTILARGIEIDEGDWVRLVDRRHKLIAVGSVVERIGSGEVRVVQPRIVFN